MSITGQWNLTIATPIGKQHVILDLIEEDGVVRGTAKGETEEVPLIEPTLHDNRLEWKQSITRPMRLNLRFDVTIDGDRLIGVSKAGLLPKSKVTGMRAD